MPSETQLMNDPSQPKKGLSAQEATVFEAEIKDLKISKSQGDKVKKELEQQVGSLKSQLA